MLSPRQQHCLDHIGITRWTRAETNTTLPEPLLSDRAVSPQPQLAEPRIEVFIPVSVQPALAEKADNLKNYDLDHWPDLQLAIEACTNCELSQNCTRKVAGKGNTQAELMIIGEAPGQDEDLQGLPFVGRAGQLLDRILQAIGLNTQDVFITNILKCRPPNNRDPKLHEADACAQFLSAQIKFIQPKVILSVGRISAQTLLKDHSPLGQLRTRQHVLTDTNIPLLVTYHPAYLLRNPTQKVKVWHDMKNLKLLLSEPNQSL